MTDLSKISVVIASDHAGFALKQEVKALLDQWAVSAEDLGTHDTASTDYPDYAHQVAERVAGDGAVLGILVCGTGMGMGMTANRHKGVRAAVCTDAYQARMTRLHNDANVLCIGARVIGGGVAEDIVRMFLETAFEGGRHQRRVGKIELISAGE